MKFRKVVERLSRVNDAVFQDYRDAETGTSVQQPFFFTGGFLTAAAAETGFLGAGAAGAASAGDGSSFGGMTTRGPDGLATGAGAGGAAAGLPLTSTLSAHSFTCNDID
jgi:hypothetical protein